MSLTRSNIAYDLKISPHTCEVFYQDKKLKYVFSSELYKNKFKEKMQDHRNSINESLSKRFGFMINNEMIADLKLYSSIEKRGFLIYQGEDIFECQRSIILDGNHLMIKN